MNARDLIIKHEDRVPYAYPDSRGFLTIGVGHLIDKRKGGSLPEHVIDALFDYDFELHRKELFAQLPWVADMDEVRQAAMIDMYFQLRGNLLGFHESLRYIQARAWTSAATELLDSDWARETPERAHEISEMIRTGTWQ